MQFASETPPTFLRIIQNLHEYASVCESKDINRFTDPIGHRVGTVAYKSQCFTLINSQILLVLLFLTNKYLDLLLVKN